MGIDSKEPLTWGNYLIDNMGEADIRHRLAVLARQEVALREIAAQLHNERQDLLLTACNNEHHKGWARAQFDAEEASRELLNYPGIARTVLPVRRVGWADESKEKG